MLAPRLAATAVVLLAAAPALAQPSVTPPPADAAPVVEGDVTVSVGASQGSDTDVANAAEKPAPPTTATTRTASAAPSMVEPVEPFAPPPPALTPAASYVDRDAASGRAFVTPTGFTGPKGHASIEVTFPALPVGGFALARYSLTDRIEIGAGGIAVIEEDAGAVAVLTAKVQILRRPTGGVALQALHVEVPDEDDGGTFFSAVGSKCLGRDCRTLLTAHLTLLPFSEYYYSDGGGEGEQGALAVIPGVSLVTGDRTKLVLDGVLVGDDSERFAVLYTGIRFARRSFSFDGGLVAAANGDDAEALPMPLCSLTGRF